MLLLVVSGQITIGHAGFMSVGAYAAALFTKSGIVEGLPGYFFSSNYWRSCCRSSWNHNRYSSS